MTRATFITLVLVCACGPENRRGNGPDVTETSARALEHRDDESVISRQGNGLFRNEPGLEVIITPSGPSKRTYVDWGYWVDIRVQNLSFDKSVGVIWSADGWQTTNLSTASYEYPLDGNFEQWGLDLTGRSYSGSVPRLEYVVFVEMNGTRTYGKQGNWQNYTVSP